MCATEGCTDRQTQDDGHGQTKRQQQTDRLTDTDTQIDRCQTNRQMSVSLWDINCNL